MAAWGPTYYMKVILAVGPQPDKLHIGQSVKIIDDLKQKAEYNAYVNGIVGLLETCTGDGLGLDNRLRYVQEAVVENREDDRAFDEEATGRILPLTQKLFSIGLKQASFPADIAILLTEILKKCGTSHEALIQMSRANIGQAASVFEATLRKHEGLGATA